MSSSPFLLIPLIASSQNNKYLTANGAVDQLDEALNQEYGYAISGNTVVPSAQGSEWYENMVFNFTGSLSGAATITIPASERLFIVKNSTTGGFNLKFTTGSGGIAYAAPSSSYWMLYCDGTNVVNVSGAPIAFASFQGGTDTNGHIWFETDLLFPVWFPANAPNSIAKAGTAATGSTTYTFSKNGTPFATAVFSASGTVASWTQASDAFFAAGDVLELQAPATADATLANIRIALQGIRI